MATQEHADEHTGHQLASSGYPASGHPASGHPAHAPTGHEVAEHRHERPEDWGWHAESGTLGRVAGIISALLLVAMVWSTYGSKWELVWSFGFAAAIVVGLLWDLNRRRNSWRG
ncbi:MAG TPA: DUF2631 domain-containing protein [Mycobacteriales bacterium]|nr:DUF2631 domain-containing protein [Mycobacteriales bacterium]